MKNNNPKYAFYYLLSLVSLIFMTISLVLIVFQIIDKSIFDALSTGNYFGDSQIRFGISALIISAPIFFLMSTFINKGLRKKDIDIDSSVRRWLTYFILFVSAVIILGSLVGMLNNFLSGEITLRFILKVLFVVLLSALVFSFYLYDIKRSAIKNNDRVLKAFFLASLILVVIIFSASWFFVESPKTARERKIDNIVLNNIYSLENYINIYYEKNKELPDDLLDLRQATGVSFSDKMFNDPETGEEIGYKKLGEKSFELCANFRTDSYESRRNETYPIYYGDTSKVYVHGYNCFKGNLWTEDRLKD